MKRQTTTPAYLGIECGATRTVALLADANSRLIQRHVGGPANLRLLNDSALLSHFRRIAQAMPRPTALAIGMAGARTTNDFQRIRRAAEVVWPGMPVRVTNDLETALAAAALPDKRPRARVLVLSGTGSCCFGASANGRTAKVGGWGHILGDKGSGYEIGLRGLKATIYYYDRDGVWPKLGQRLLRKLCLNEPNDFIDWVHKASKSDIAELAVEVFSAWEHGDKISADILDGAANSLAKDAAACAKRLTKAGRVQFVLAGSVLLKQPRFARKVAALIGRLWKNALITPLQRESAWGAVELALSLSERGTSRAVAASNASSRRDLRAAPTGDPSRFERIRASHQPEVPEDLKRLVESPTEQRNPRSMNLDVLPVRAAIRLMLSEDAQIPDAVRKQESKIERVIEWIVQAFKTGGRLFYVGAGTSGRLGVLDASECPPTFRSDPETVQGIIAGGQRALWEAVEGAEDDPSAGAHAVQFRGVGKYDVIVGIAASGRTPFVWGALEAASRKGARTVLISFNPKLSVPKAWRPDIIIAPNVGPEILTGSTRLKAGTATKLILNMLTTLAMVRVGKVLSNLMIDVKASNTKLRDRAVRIVQQVTDLDYTNARTALEKANWDIKGACKSLGRKRSRITA